MRQFIMVPALLMSSFGCMAQVYSGYYKMKDVKLDTLWCYEKPDTANVVALHYDNEQLTPQVDSCLMVSWWDGAHRKRKLIMARRQGEINIERVLLLKGPYKGIWHVPQ